MTRSSRGYFAQVAPVIFERGAIRMRVFAWAPFETIEYLLMELHERRAGKRGARGVFEIVRKPSLGSRVRAQM